MGKGKIFGKMGTKLANFGAKFHIFLENCKNCATNFKKVHCTGMIFHGNSMHFKGPILEAKFWGERMVLK